MYRVGIIYQATVFLQRIVFWLEKSILFMFSNKLMYEYKNEIIFVK